ncbi:MAG: S-layer family protein [Nostoc sp. ChiSLP02]|nr:S-layer family protein [Nostoc sp. DedSLP05]MDZ8101944.1 S-layer family protein [Nostoc sp. DedSLP01]MDZ8186255.1 S-layer family protein [Nostoc sp. ChiSLP02]
MSFKTAPNWLQGLGVAIINAVTLYTNSSVAQITPDGTLPNNSNVKLDGNTTIIEGGTIRGGNLFHSFSEFSVPTNSTALFKNAADIQNIISRVTGNSISNIDGLIRANAANLFLINPNGIIFGQNARLDIGGSFFATSADVMKFADGLEFSAKKPQPTPLLTISVPIGLQFGANPGLIQVQGNGQGVRDFNSPIIDTQDALRVRPNRTLALVGGDINLEGATLKTAGGKIELGSVAGNGLVSLTPTSKGFALGYSGVQSFGNIQLSQQATVDASGEGGGDIQLQGKRVTLTNGSQIETSTLGTKQGGNLLVNATESVNASGRYSDLSAQVYPNATGNAGNLTINTREFLIRDGAQVSATTFGAGQGGNLAVTADSVQVVGRSSASRSSSLGAQSQDIGNAGNLTINTRELLIRDGGFVSTATFGAGKGGNLAVTADSVQVVGRSSDGRFSNLVAQSVGRGNAGDLTINTRELLIRDGTFVSTATFGAAKGGNLAITADSVQVIGNFSILSAQAGKSTGDGGDLRINTRELLIRDGANVSTATFGAGKGGNLAITADSVQVIGRSSDGRFISFLSAAADRGSTGDGGDLRINTRELLIRDGANVSASTFDAKGKAGDITVNANSIVLNNAGEINANTTGGGGNIIVNSPLLLLRRGSSITTNASGDNISGGNITIDAKNGFIIAVPLENSDIRADSANFRGGNIIIKNIAGIFGIQSRKEPSPNSDITAKGATPDLIGNIEITLPDLDPTQGLVELPINLVDASNQISTACTPGTRQFQNTFVATGRGGLPMSPTEPLQDSSTVSVWVKLRPKSENLANITPVPQPTEVSATSIAATIPIVEASGWVIDRKGNIELVAQVPQLNPHSPWQTPADCPVSQGGVKYGKTSAAKASN